MDIKKKRYVFISNMASPYQVKFCYALQEYFEAEFWFYEQLDKTRPEWWKVPLGDKCKIMKGSGSMPKIGYYSFGLFLELIRFKPNIIVLGGFMKWHFLVLKIAKLFSIKVAVMSEPLRYVSNDDQQSSALMNRSNSAKKLSLYRKLFNDVDLYIGMGEIAARQFIEEFEFPSDRVAIGRYPQDIDEYFKHPLKTRKSGENYRILFANRLVERYNPLFALDVFEKVKEKYPNVEMYLNNDGPLKKQCIDFIEKKQLQNVFFLDQIDSWNNMHLIYKESDILILPATYSNGNMTIMEAKASGMGLVLSNRISGVDINNIKNENCFICDLKLEEFVNSIEKYIEEPELLVSHGELSRKLVAKFSNENTSKIYYELFNKYGLLD